MSRETQTTLQRLGLVLGVVVAASTLLGFVASLGARIASADFVTVSKHAEDLDAVRASFREQLQAAAQLQAQREAAIVQRLDSLRTEQRESEERLTKQLSSILNILLQRGR